MPTSHIKLIFGLRPWDEACFALATGCLGIELHPSIASSQKQIKIKQSLG